MLHDEAMRYCDEALAARSAGNSLAERAYLERALRRELRAASYSACRKHSLTTIAVLTRSAANIVERIVELERTP